MKRTLGHDSGELAAWLTIAVMAFLFLAIPCRLWGEDAQPSPVASPKPDRTQLEVQFKKVETDRLAAKEKTKERAEAARNAMQIASDIAWLAFDAGKFEDAANWFAKSAELKQDSYANARAYWEEELRTAAVEEDGRIDGQIKELQTQLAAAEESKKGLLRTLIHGWEKNRYLIRYNTLTMLEQIARDNNDAENLLKYSEREVEIRRLELSYLQKVKAPVEETNKKIAQVATSLERVASAQADLALFAQAEKNGQEALALRKALPEDMAERKLHESLSALALVYAFYVGDLVRARDYYQQALASIEASAAVRKKALQEERFYTPEQKAAMTEEELAKHKQTDAQMRDMTLALDWMSQAMALLNLGDISQEEGDLKKAISYYEKARKVGEDLPKGGYLQIFETFRARIRARVLGGLAYLHAESGEVDLALNELNETIALKREIGQDDWTAQSLLQAADLAHNKGDIANARHFLEQARQIFSAAHKLNSVVSATAYLAVIARDEGKLDEAAVRGEEALVLARKTGNVGSISGSARTLASIRVQQNKLDEARMLLEETRAADAKTGSIGDRIGTLGIEGEVFEASGENEKALEVYREAVKLVESVRATAASETAFSDVKRNYRPYERIVRVLIKLNRTGDAFDYLNRAKSKKLQESLRLSSVKSGDKATQALIDQAGALEKQVQKATAQLEAEKTKPEEQRDQTKIANLQRVVVTGQGDMRRVFEKIKASSPNWAKHMEFSPKSLEAARRGIPEDVLLVQYAPMADQLYIFVVSSKEVKIVIAPSKPEELWKKIDTVRGQIVTGEQGAPINKNLIALYELLITPIEPEFEGIKTIAIIPNQRLFYLPIHALAKKQADGKIRYLIEDKEIVYLADADVMNVIQGADKSKAPGGMIAFGNPTGANLPASEQEVKAIAQVFPATEVRSGGDVTKVSLHKEQMLDKRIIHFATHGILNAANPTESYIQLAKGGTPELEHLKVDEIWDLPFKKVTLVTLSACESALGGKDPDGTEITSLAEGFSTAGATSVLASLWKVGDESTKELMVEFYKQLATPGVSKAAALQAAEVKLLKDPKFSRPLYWAPFVLMGDWR